jgi:hypothetical protein
MLFRRDPGASRSALAPGYLLPRLRRWLISYSLLYRRLRRLVPDGTVKDEALLSEL